MQRIAVIGAGLTMSHLQLIQDKYPTHEIVILDKLPKERLQTVVPIRPYHLKEAQKAESYMTMRKSANQPWKKSWKK